MRARTLLVSAVLLAGSVQTLFAEAASSASANLTRYPYLTDVVGTSATINFATDRSATEASATFGVAGNEACTAHRVGASKTSITVNGVGEYQWRATFGVKPDTTYCYRVFLGTAPGTDLLGADPSPTFVSQLPAGSTKPFTFAAFGDWGKAGAGGNADQANIMSIIAGSGVRFAVGTGDTGYPSGSQTSYGDLQQTGSDVSAVFGPSFWAVPGRSIPLFNAVGNHSPDATYITNWPSKQAAAQSKGKFTTETYCCVNGTKSATLASAWYAFDAGTTRIYILQAAWPGSNVGTGTEYSDDYAAHWTPTSAEYKWLAGDLAAHRSGLKIAVFHYPLRSDQSTETSDPYLQGDASLEGLLTANGVRLVLNGHAHIYERNVARSGLVQYVTGGGGASLQSVGPCSPFDAFAVGWKPATNAGLACGAAPVPDAPSRVYHFLLISVDGMRVTVTPVDELGRAFDVQTYDFSTPDVQPPTTPAGVTAAATSQTTVKLSWWPSTDNVEVAGYTVARDGTPVGATDGSTTSFTDTSAPPGTSNTYTVSAFDAAGNVSATSDPVTVATPTTSVLLPTDDAYVDASYPTTNFGTRSPLSVDANPVRHTFLKFSVTGTGGCPNAKATLRLFNVNPSADGGDVYAVADTSWTESTVTWNTQPALGAQLASLGPVASGTAYDVDVTPLITGDGVFSIGMTSTSTDGADYSSKETLTVSQRPSLTVQCGTS